MSEAREVEANYGGDWREEYVPESAREFLERCVDFDSSVTGGDAMTMAELYRAYHDWVWTDPGLPIASLSAFAYQVEEVMWERISGRETRIRPDGTMTEGRFVDMVVVNVKESVSESKCVTDWYDQRGGHDWEDVPMRVADLAPVDPEDDF